MLSLQYKNIRYTFNQLADFLSVVKEEEYSKSVAQLTGLSVGKHVRHCIEVLENLTVGLETSNVFYDRRKRNPLYETSPLAARDKIFELLGKLERIDENKIIELSYLIDPNTGLEGKTTTNLKREFLYVQDHTIHHMAIIKLYACFLQNVSLPEEFGVALSTLQFQKKFNTKDVRTKNSES
ncbi:hypothetical protein [Leptospira santarosai]|uniref:DinB family protein n=5 Tax=Leptospira santarosai TaxID=28183 RepID=A0AB73M5S2_9LEPT|nr:hypothetical protein [Leptospira santarosai]EMO59947.1 hypothetical protein LEP1GSC161_0963 [Leptospira santarosai str. CBC1416]AVV50573.1 Uncharacterized protein XB17_01987 [Leptospira santarosai]AVV80869.1 Uncharacterized protein XB15_03129 [Leptospira santarosai]EKR91726.1 hypothetical protein LEP1GSC163_2866 [Leptospira santarosai str. CBC379]EKS09323.1 hypothetical protein LEP1GSC071_3578 [Leptospira santarosai str. JET]